MAIASTRVKITPKLDLAQPPMFRVVYLNDDVTSMEFVVSSLIQYFDYTDETAEDITYAIHEKGSAVVAVLPFEIAEQKGLEVTVDARANSYPLQIKIEPDEEVQ